MEHNHLACIERSWKVRRSQCMCVMSGLERRISLTSRNDYGNNMIICLLSLSSFFLTANPRCCEMGEDFSKCFRDNLPVAWMDLLCTLLSFACSSILCFLRDGELKDKVKSSSWEKSASWLKVAFSRCASLSVYLFVHLLVVKSIS